MAWNEPGGNNQDPWGSGRKGRNDGPPDLDEVVRKGMDKINRLFGGGKGSRGDQPGGTGSSGIFIIIIAVLAAITVFNSIYRVDEKERAIVLRLGKYHTTEDPGLRFRIPLIDRIFIEEVTSVRTQKKKGHMLTEDENIVDIDLEVQFVIGDLKNYKLNVREPLVTLDFAIDSALRHEVGSTEMDQVLTEGREVLAVDVQRRLQDYLNFYGAGILLRSVNINAAQPPAAVKSAFEDVQRAKEDEQKVVNQAEAYRNKVVPESRGRSQRIIEEANAYKSEVIARAEGDTARFLSVLSIYEQAPEVTRERMYIDTMQSVFSNSSKILVDQEQSGNVLFMPLAELMGNNSPSADRSVAPPQSLRPHRDSQRQQTERNNPLRSRR